MSKSHREQFSFKNTPEEQDLYNFYLKQATKYGKSEYIKKLIRRDQRGKLKNAKKD